MTNYGKRSGLGDADRGIRKVAPTYGKTAFHTYAVKSTGSIVLEGRAERLVCKALDIDPSVAKSKAQPFTVDLVDRQLLHTAEERRLARKKHGERDEQIFYTPDLSASRTNRTTHAIEVKLEGFEGDEAYQAMLENAKEILWNHGYIFKRIVIPSEWDHPLLLNIQLLHQAKLRNDLAPTAELLSRLDALGDIGTITLSDFCRRLEIAPGLVPVLIIHGAVSAEIEAHPLRGDALLTPAYGSLDHLHLLDRLAR